jgi:hypothetical protein
MMQSMVNPGDFSLNLRLNAVEAKVAAEMAAADPAGADHHHYPYARQVRVGWHQDAAGKWAYASVDDHLWEVVCQQCGDTDGPAENQTPEVRKLRGPYPGKHRAKHVAGKHFKEH